MLHRNKGDGKSVRCDLAHFHVEIEVFNEPQMLYNSVQCTVRLFSNTLAPKCSIHPGTAAVLYPTPLIALLLLTKVYS